MPNATRLLPAGMNARLSAALMPNGAAGHAEFAGPVSGSAGLKATVLALLAGSRSVERRFRIVPRSNRRALKRVAAVALMERANVPEMEGDIRRLWNHRAAMDVVLARARTGTLSFETIVAIYDALNEPAAVPAKPGAAAPRPLVRPSMIRTAPLALTRTSYRPADGAALEAGLRRIVATGAAITDPVEQAFFVFAQVLLLLPFAAENVSMAALLANFSLLRVQLRPIAWVSAGDRGVIPAMIAWWEFNRPEALAECILQSAGA